MAEIEWAPKAIRQLENIGDYIEADSAFHARRVVMLIVRATRKLAVFPEYGAIVPQFREEAVREIRVYNYRILYDFQEKFRKIRILGVVHGMQQMDDSFLSDTRE